ncbi:MAG: nucleotide exchange factor GrpE [Candidatus Eremiobacteraeota bacterium]|nr:nucleotide exchange factor GrpE [Candidatus Eremiobacteraeota bacterium]
MSEYDIHDPYHARRHKVKSALKKDVKREPDVFKIPIEAGGAKDQEQKPMTIEKAEEGPAKLDTATPSDPPAGKTGENLPAEMPEESKKDKDRIQELEEQVKRLQADFENFRRRKEEEVAKAGKYAAEKVIVAMLPIIDNFDRAVAASQLSKNYDALVEGIQMVQKQVWSMLEKEGVTEIKAQGEPFNPSLHQAVSSEENDDLPEETVTKELQKGFLLKDRVIRPAMVVVSKKSA